MATYLISYDLNQPGQKYQDLYDEIKKLADAWWHQLDSTWIIQHSGNASEIRNALRPHIEKNDELLVVKLSNEAAWSGLGEKSSSWLKKHL